MRRLRILIITALFSSFAWNSLHAQICYTNASKLGLVKNSVEKADYNYERLKSAISSKKHIRLDGIYYVNFKKPIILDYPLHIKNGEMRIVRGNAFDFASGGGFFANKTVFRRENPDEVATLCGTWDKHSAIKLTGFEFNQSSYYGRHLLRLIFEDIDGRKQDFGITTVSIKDSYFCYGGAVTILDAIITDRCRFSGNKYERLPITPIYICYSHSRKQNPIEDGAYWFVEENMAQSCPIYIENNEFIGETVSYDYYYCSALIEAAVCYFKNNYLSGFANYSDGTQLSHATCYDAYLSCAEVYFEDNVIENLVSFSKNGGNKPQCEIGKSKRNILSAVGYKTVRHYVHNSFILDGNIYLAMGADRSSLYTSIFGNVSYVDDYVWKDNIIIYKNADLAGRTSSTGYGSFIMTGNKIEVDRILNNGLCMLSSGNDMEAIRISENEFNIHSGEAFSLFNQVYKEDYLQHKSGSIVIQKNIVKGASPKIFFFSADDVEISGNTFEPAIVESNYYISNDTGKKTPMNVRRMNVSLPFDSQKEAPFYMNANFSSKTLGTFEYSLSKLSSRTMLTGNYTYGDNDDFLWIISYMSYGKETTVPVTIDISEIGAYATIDSNKVKLSDNWRSVVKQDGIEFRVRFDMNKRLIEYVLTGSPSSRIDFNAPVKLRYVNN